MTQAIGIKRGKIKRKERFQEFIFIGDNFDTSISQKIKQLQVNPDSKAVNQASVEDSLVITQIRAAKNIARQLKKLKVHPGAAIELVSKTNKGSVIISLGNKLIGISAEIAGQIAVTPAN